jgi:hypothetical protein
MYKNFYMTYFIDFIFFMLYNCDFIDKILQDMIINLNFVYELTTKYNFMGVWILCFNTKYAE